jgi:hypothetical protein
MSEEYDSSNVYYSPFWPLTIVLVGFIAWLGYQIFFLNEQRNAYNSQIQQAMPMLQQSQIAQTRLVNLMKDLAQTSATDPYAKQIMKAAIDAGLVRVSPATNAPAATSTSADSTTSTTNKS